MDRAKDLLTRVGLHRPEIRAWAMYDWANSAFATTIITAIFPVYFTSVAGANLPAGEATRLLARTTTIALATSAILAPFLGALADYAPIKKRLLGLFTAIGCIAAGCLVLVHRNDWLLAAILFGIGNVGFTASLTLYDSFLPHLAREDEIDRVSTAGFGLGYLGGGLLLALNVAWILSPSTFGISDAGQASRLSFLSVALWWALFSIPLFRRVPEPAVVGAGARSTVALMRASLLGLVHTLRDLRRYRQAFLLLVAFVIYSDGIGTIIRLATSYGTELGLNQGALITAILLVQFVGIPFAFLFGMLAGSHRRENVDLHRAGGLHADYGGGLLHEDRARLLPARTHGRLGAGRKPGAQPLSLCQHDSERAVVGVLRVLLDLREVRRDCRPGGVRSGQPRDRLEPQRDSQRDGVLYCRSRGADASGCARRSRGCEESVEFFISALP